MCFFGNWWLPTGRIDIGCSLGYCCLQDKKGYSGTLKNLFSLKFMWMICTSKEEEEKKEENWRILQSIKLIPPKYLIDLRTEFNQFSRFFSIITMYIDSLPTKILKIKVIKRDNTGHKFHVRYIPLTVNSVPRLNIKYI